MNMPRTLTRFTNVVATVNRGGRVVIALMLVTLVVAASARSAGARPISDDVRVDATDGVVPDDTPVPTATVMINLHACPAGLDPTGMDIYAVAATCNLPAAPMSFELSTPDNGYAATFDWLWTWDDVTPGKLDLRQVIPAGYLPSFAYCKQSAGFTLAPVADGELIIEVLPGETLYCDWMVTPARKRLRDDIAINNVDLVAVDAGTTAPAGPSSLFVNGTACPEGFDAYAADMYGLAAGCGIDGPVADFEFSMPTGYLALTGGDPSVDPIQAGEIAVTYHIPAGFGLPRVFCTRDQLQDLPTYEATVSNLGDAANWTITVAPGAWAYCDIFSIPGAVSGGQAGRTASVTVLHYGCAASALQGQLTLDNLQARCPALSTAFTAVDANGQETIASDPAGFTGLAAGAATIEHAPLAGLDGPELVFCGGAIYGDGFVAHLVPFQPEAIDGAVTLDLSGGEELLCAWFSLDEGAGPFDGPASVADDAVAVASDDAAEPTGASEAEASEPVMIVSREG